jgi:hypothetical protein
MDSICSAQSRVSKTRRSRVEVVAPGARRPWTRVTRVTHQHYQRSQALSPARIQRLIDHQLILHIMLHDLLVAWGEDSGKHASSVILVLRSVSYLTDNAS